MPVGISRAESTLLANRRRCVSKSKEGIDRGRSAPADEKYSIEREESEHHGQRRSALLGKGNSKICPGKSLGGEPFENATM